MHVRKYAIGLFMGGAFIALRIAVVSLTGERRHSETRAIESIREIAAAEAGHYSRYGRFASLDEIAAASSPRAMGFTESNLGKIGYHLDFHCSDAQYSVVLQTLSHNGQYNFYTDQTLIIRFTHPPEIPSSNSPIFK